MALKPPVFPFLCTSQELSDGGPQPPVDERSLRFGSENRLLL
jgi:hypothetical protein